MNVLAFDTCFGACSAAIQFAGGGSVARQAVRFEVMTKGHAERLLPFIDEVMREVGASYADLDRLAVTIGPGSFTGTRVGIAAARGLALATGLPVYGTTSLATIAGRALRPSRAHHRNPAGLCKHDNETDGIIAACTDARRGSVYLQLFSAMDMPPCAPAQILNLQQAAAVLHACPSKKIRVLGTCAEALVDAAMDHRCINAQSQRREELQLEVIAGDGLGDAESLLEVWLERLEPPKTLYLRPPDAKPQAGKSIPRAVKPLGQ